MTESLFTDFLTEIVDTVADRDTQKFIELFDSNSASWDELRKWNQKHDNWYGGDRITGTIKVREKCLNEKSIADFVTISPPVGNIESVDVRINNEIDPFGQLRKKINQRKAFRESEVTEEAEESLDICENEEEEHIDQDVQVNLEKQCYYPSQEIMAAILKKRIDTIMSHYHNISSLRDKFDDVEFVVYTARYRMLSDQTEKRIRHPEAGVLSSEELETRDDSDAKKRMFMYLHSPETTKHFEELKRKVTEKERTLFVIIADECHWGITKDKEEKASAHNLFINEWCKGNSPTNVFVVQISATPFNLLTRNSRLPEVRCVLSSDETSTTQNHDSEADDLVVLKEESNLAEHVEPNSKELELHVVHWSEVELKNFEGGMQMKLKSALLNQDAKYQYLCVSSDGKLSVTPIEEDANDFIVQGSQGIVTLKVLTTEEQQAKTLTVGEDAHGNLEVKDDPRQSTTFEIKLEFGIGIVAFCSCKKPDQYIAVNKIGQVSLHAAKVKRKWGVSKIEPKYQGVKVSCEFYTEQCRPAKGDITWQQYMSLNYYLSTMNCCNKKDQKIRKDEIFEEIVEKANISDSSAFPIDALLCAEYCYHILHLSVYSSDEKIRKALTFADKESSASEFDKKLDFFLKSLKKDPGIYIHFEAFELVRGKLREEASSNFRSNLKEVARLESLSSSQEKHEKLKEIKKVLVDSFVDCLMHLPRQELQQIIEEKHSSSIVEDIKQTLQENGYKAMIKTWNSIAEESETFSLVKGLIQSGKGEMGKMKIVRARSMKTANQFYNTLRLVREVSSLEKCFEVIRDYGGIQIEKQMMKLSSPFFPKLQPDICMFKSDCGCSKFYQQPSCLKCASCNHVHKSITQYEDLENLACVLILVEKGRMGDTFPQSFDCLDLRLSYDSSHLSSLIQELGRLCRYVQVFVGENCVGDPPYVLVGPELFKTLNKSLDESPSMSAVSCSGVDRYMTKIRGSKHVTSYSWRWPDYEAQKDSFDYQNQDKHRNRILLQAEPQIGKTGAYLCLIKLLRQDIIQDENVSSTSTAAFDEGIIYCRKECHCSIEVVVNDKQGKEDWQFPFWESIQNSPRLSDKPVKEGKYSIRGQFYTHDTEEFPHFLLKPEQANLAKSISHPVKSDCRDDLRAWHWYHFKKCAQCKMHLQGKESVVETLEVNIDGAPVRVKCSVPNKHESYKHLIELVKSTEANKEAFPEFNLAAAVDDAPSLAYWIFHPSHRNDPGKCTLNYNHVMQETGHAANYIQVVVVRSEKFLDYRSFWGKVLAVLELPDELPGCERGPTEGGVGYARLFIQKVAHFLGLEYVFVIDDNVVVMKEAEFESSDDVISATEENVSRKGNGVMRMKRCPFIKPLRCLEKIAQGKDTPPREVEEYKPHPLKDQLPTEASRYPLYTYTGPAKLFDDRPYESYGVLGLLNSVPNAVKPFSKTQVYAAILLNIQSTVKKGVFYRPWPFWEDLRFNDDCDKVGLWVVKCNRYHFQKFQYNDWMSQLVPPRIFEWKKDTILEEKPRSSAIPKDFEEGIILEHLHNFVNIQGPERCFKACIGYDRQENIEDPVSPARIVQQVEANEGTDEAFANGTPVLILSYCVTTSKREDRNLLDSRFQSTKEKMVFVTSAEEAFDEWPGMTLATMPTKRGICFYAEMEQRNAKFAIYSAADPRKHRLRYILIEASFPQDKITDEETSISIREESTAEKNEAHARWEPADRMQETSNKKKRVKRSFGKQANDSVPNKKGKLNGGCSQNEDLRPATGAVKVKVERGEHETSHVESEMQGSRKVKRLKSGGVAEEMQHTSEESGIRGINGHDTGSVTLQHASNNVNETSASEMQNTVVSEERGGQTEAEYSNGSAVNLTQDEEMPSITMTADRNLLSAQAKDEGGGELDDVVAAARGSGKVQCRKRRSKPSTKKMKPNDPAYLEGTTDVTGKLVELWTQYREIQGLKEQKDSSDLSENDVRDQLMSFSSEQLQTTDEKGYTALLKACSLPSMSPHVMQYLITARKVDLNCQLPPNFDRNNPASEGLVPGMFALSVSIRGGNVKSVPTFMTRQADINVRSKDQDGNTALHHCVLSHSKVSFQKLFPLYKPLEWKEMHNNEGKNPLDICVAEIELIEGKKEKEKALKTLSYMRQEMEKVSA